MKEKGIKEDEYDDKTITKYFKNICVVTIDRL